MKKINNYYRFMLCVNLCFSLSGCGCWLKSYMMHSPSFGEAQVVNKPFHPNLSRFDIALDFDNLLEKVYILFEKLKECCSYIDRHSSDYNHAKISKMYSCMQPTTSKDQMLLFQKSYNKLLNKLFFDPVMRGQQFQNQQFKNINAQNVTFWDFAYRVAYYLENYFLPYYGHVLQRSVAHALNESTKKAEMGSVKSTVTTYHTSPCNTVYNAACEAIKSSYNTQSVDYVDKFFSNFIEEHKQYYPSEIIQKVEELEVFRLKPIKKMYTNLNILIRSIKFYSNELKIKHTKTLIEHLKMFYNIAYAFGITDLIFFLTHLISPLEINQVELVRINVYLADFIKNKHVSLHEMNNKIKELINGVTTLLKTQVKI